MKEYEVIWEIFNKCPRNQMRDVFVEEVEIEDPEEYIKKKFQGKEVSYDKTVLNDGTIIFDIFKSQIKQRCYFTEIYKVLYNTNSGIQIIYCNHAVCKSVSR